MNEKLAQALDHIDEKKISDAATARRKRHLFLKTIAAILVVVILMNFNLPIISLRVNAKTVSEASGSRAAARPDRDDYDSFEEFRAVLDAYDEARRLESEGVTSALTNLNDFFAGTASACMTQSTTENLVFSPVNAYISLAALAEVTAGESRQQILTALNTPDLETLRFQVGAVWEEVYWERGNEICSLASSMWIDDSLDYQQGVMDDLALYYYTSVYQKNLSSRGAGRALATWINNNTGGMLKSNTEKIQFPDIPVLTLVSTVYLQSKWSDQFSRTRNTSGVFHAPSGDRNATYMNIQDEAYYYWTEDYGASYRGLKNGCKMWFFLPDEDKTVADVLKNGEYLKIIQPNPEENESRRKYLFVNWTVPKFDVSYSTDLSDAFKAQGITDVFSPEISDFTAITSDIPVYLTGANQSARVIIDEEGVKAASYIELPGAGAGEPPDDEVDMILDRPFVFVIADTNGIPLFTGVVNEP